MSEVFATACISVTVCPVPNYLIRITKFGKLDRRCRQARMAKLIASMAGIHACSRTQPHDQNSAAKEVIHARE